MPTEEKPVSGQLFETTLKHPEGRRKDQGPEDLDKDISRYVTELQPVYKTFSLKVEELVRSILKQKRVTPHSVTSREKSATSLKEKMTREGKSYEEPLKQITDLAGVRVITYFPKDVDAIVPLLEKQFTVDTENSVDKRQSKDPSAFGYASVHLVVQLTNARAKLPEYEMFKGLKCEVQVRTILQHAWAEIEHDIVYKSNDEIPFELRRKFASLAGLLEVADREFEMLRREESEVRKKITKTIASENLDVPIDLDSLTAYFKKYHQLDNAEPHRLTGFLRALTEHKVATVGDLHRMLTKEAIADGNTVELRAFQECKRAAPGCLLRYFVAVGRHLRLPDAAIGELAGCPVLAPNGYRKARMRERLKDTPISLDHKREAGAEPPRKPGNGAAGGPAA